MGRIKTKITKTYAKTELMANVLNQMRYQAEKDYIAGIMKEYDCDEEKAREFIFRDEDSEEYRGYAFVLEVSELRQAGKFESANKLIKKHKKEYKQYLKDHPEEKAKAHESYLKDMNIRK